MPAAQPQFHVPGAGAGTADAPMGTAASSPPMAGASAANAVCTQPHLCKHKKAQME